MFPKIEIKASGFRTCTLLGKGEIKASFMKSGRKFFVVAATTPTDKHHVSAEMYEKRVKVIPEDIGGAGYLVYFGTNNEGWVELISFDDRRFTGYEEELMDQVSKCS